MNGIHHRPYSRRFRVARAMSVVALLLISVLTWGATTARAGYSDAVLADQPLGYWRLGDVEGATVAEDSSGLEHSGTYRGVTTDVPGALDDESNTAADFNPIGDVPFSGEIAIPLGGLVRPFTVEAWFLAAGEGTLVGEGGGVPVGLHHRWYIAAEGSALKAVWVFDTGCRLTTTGPAMPIDDDGWHHVVVVFGASDTKMWVDGLRDSAPNVTTCPTPDTSEPSDTTGITIGDVLSRAPWSGAIDDVAIYPGALQVGRIRAHLDAALDLDPYKDQLLAEKPVGFWRLGESNGALTAVDESATGNNGSYVGAELGLAGAIQTDSNTAAQFGPTASLSVPNSSSLNFGAGNFSFESWINTSATGPRTLVSKGSPAPVDCPGPPFWKFGIQADGRLRLEVDDNTLFDGSGCSVSRIFLGPDIVLSDGSWHHVGFIAERTSGIVRIYVDDKELSAAGATTGTVNSTGPVILGKDLAGLMDEAALYPYALVPRLMALRYRNGLSPSVVQPDSAFPLDGEPGVSELMADAASGPQSDLGSAPDDMAWPYGLRAPGNEGDTNPTDASAPATEIFDNHNWVGTPSGTGDDGAIVPDSTGAVGPNIYIHALNNKVIAYDKDDHSQIGPSVSLAQFTGFPSRLITDPVIMWDRHSSRWYYAATTRRSPYVVIYGWSLRHPGELTTWCKKYSGPYDQLMDQPKLGDSLHHVILTVQESHPGNPEDDFDRAFALTKPSAGDNSCRSTYVTLFPSPLRTPQGQLVYSGTAVNYAGKDRHRFGFIVAADNGQFQSTLDDVTLWWVGGPPRHPALGAPRSFHVGQYSEPTRAPQPEGERGLDTMDGRLQNAVAMRDPSGDVLRAAIWTQHTIGTGPSAQTGPSAVRWYELIPSTLAIRQKGIVRAGARWAFNAAISPGMNGQAAVLHFNVANGTTYVEAWARSRKAQTPLNQLGPPLVIAQSASDPLTYLDGCGMPGCRWGDYAGASPDPRRSRVVWGSTELVAQRRTDNCNFFPFYQGNCANWVTRNFALRPQ